MNILLLGGTGVIGSYLVQLLNKSNNDVCVTSRIPRTNFGKIKYVQGNAMEDIFLRKICSERRWDAIVDFMSYKTDFFANRIDWLLASTNQYVFISTARVYADKEHPIKETSPRLLDISTDSEYLASDEYALTKARQENLLIGSGKNNYTIIRPCITYGTERLQLGVWEKESWLYRALQGRSIVMPEEILRSTTTMTNGYDTSKCLANIIGNRQAIGQVIHITNNYMLTWKEIFDIYNNTFFRLTGKHIPLKVVPLSKFIELRNPRLKYQVIYDRIYNRDYDVSRQEQFISISQYIKPEDGLSHCLAEFLRGTRSFKPINFITEAKQNKLTGEHCSLQEIDGFKLKIHYFIERFF